MRTIFSEGQLTSNSVLHSDHRQYRLTLPKAKGEASVRGTGSQSLVSMSITGHLENNGLQRGITSSMRAKKDGGVRMFENRDWDNRNIYIENGSESYPRHALFPKKIYNAETWQ
jgi:hypothetical protein